MKAIKILTIFVILGSMVCACGCQDETFHNIYSTSQEEQIGQQAAGEVDSTEKIDTDAKDNTRVQAVAQAVFVQARKMRPDVPYQIKIIDSPEVNAFSLPGGYVYVYTGLLDKIGDDDDALAAVIGHESAHNVCRHVVKQMSDAGIKENIIELLGVESQSYNLYNASSAALDLEQLHYSREDEYQADKYGLMFAYNAGYDPAGMIRMFTKLESLEDGGSGGDAFAMDHPITKNRILRAEALTKILRENHGTYPANTDAIMASSPETSPTAPEPPAPPPPAPTPDLPTGPAVVSPPAGKATSPSQTAVSQSAGTSASPPGPH